MANDNKLWKSLSQADKMAVIDSFVKRGLTDLDSIRDNYEEGIQKYNNDTAAFLQSLRESNKTNSKNSKTETIEEGNQSVVQEVNNIMEEPTEASRKPVFKQVTTSDVFGDAYKPKEFAAYNKLETGGDKKRITPLKDLAYRIGADNTINGHGGANLGDIKNALNSDVVPDDIALHTYLYGNDRGLEEVVNSKGFDYSDYLNKVGYDDIKQYNGTIIPDDVYLVGTRNMELANELAKHNAHLYHSTYPDDRSNTFDVGHYIAQLGYNENGDLIVNASDVYDFYNYGDFDRESKTSSTLALQGKLMEMIGTPYIVRQDNIPIKETSIYGDFPSYSLDNLLDTLADDKIAELTESGYIEPAIVEADYPEEFAFGGNLFGDGGGPLLPEYQKEPEWISFQNELVNGINGLNPSSISNITMETYDGMPNKRISDDGERILRRLKSVDTHKNYGDETQVISSREITNFLNRAPLGDNIVPFASEKKKMDYDKETNDIINKSIFTRDAVGDLSLVDNNTHIKNLILSANQDKPFIISDLHKYRTQSRVTLDDSNKNTLYVNDNDKCKFISGKTITDNAIKEIGRVAKNRGIDPYDILSRCLIESYKGVDTNSYFNTHDVIEGQMNGRFHRNNLYNSFSNINNAMLELGMNPSKKYSKATVLKQIEKWRKLRDDAVSKVVVPENNIDAVAVRMKEIGYDFNPAQKGWTNWEGKKVKHSYNEMADEGAKLLKEKYPNLFKEKNQ